MNARAATITQRMAWLHTWGGLLFGWLLVPVFLTGSLAVFEPEIDRWMQPELALAGVAPPRAEALARAQDYLERHAAGADQWSVELPEPGGRTLSLGWRQGRAGQQRVLDAASGTDLHPRPTAGGRHFVQFHAELHAGAAGLWLVGIAALVMLAALVSGVVIHKRIFRDFFTFRPGKGQRSWLDAHNATGVLVLPFLLMIAYTGLVIPFQTFLPVSMHLLYGGDVLAPRADVVRRFERPAAGERAALLPLARYVEIAERTLGEGRATSLVVSHPGDRGALVDVARSLDDRLGAVADHVSLDGASGEPFGAQIDWNAAAYAYRVQVGLHIARFGGDLVHWLYFLCGLAGMAMMAIGLVLFVVKRRERTARPDGAAAHMLRAAEHLNVTATAGCALACAAFLWANRLLPAGLAGREGWEIRVFFLVWLATLTHALARPPRAAWIEQLAATAALCLGLPLLNLLATPAAALPRTLAHGDLACAGVDLVAAASGLVLAAVARHLRRRPATSPRSRRAAGAAP